MGTRAHPVTIFTNLGRVLYLVIIPLLRGFFLALQGDLAAWAQGAWIDILIFLGMLGFAVLRWYKVTYHYSEGGISLYSGILFRKRLWINWRKVSTVSAVESFYLKPFRAVHLRVDTLGGSHKKMDLDFLVKPAVALQVMELYRTTEGESETIPRRYEPHTLSIWALALLTSNSFGGILFIATFISQSGKLLGNEFSDRIIGTFEEVARLLAFGIPPAAAAIAYILLAGWVIGFLLTFIKYKNFSVTYKHDELTITGGIITNRKYKVDYNSVNFIDIRQSVPTKILGLFSLYLSAVGYGKEKDDIAYMIPTESRETFDASRDLLFPSFVDLPRQVKPRWTGIFRFISDPLLILAGVVIGMGVTIYLVPTWSTFTWFVGLMSLIPILVFLAVRIIDFATGGFSKGEHNYTLRYSKGITLHKVIIPKDKVVEIRIQRSPFQRFGDNCDLMVYTNSEGRERHKCRNLPLTELKSVLNL